MPGDLRQTKEGLSYVHLHIYIYIDVNECWLTSSMPSKGLTLQMLLNCAVIPENVVSED